MLTKDAIKFYGGAPRVAEVLGISLQAVCRWGEVVPKGSACELQILSADGLKVDFTLYPNRRRRG
ncbi:MAG: Cro/CI family transcriptional regulator [Gammaproteobacteria bacterium]